MKYIIPILFLFSSCRTVNKLFHKEKTSIDSTVVTHNVSIEEKHIDTTKTSQVTTTKENSIEIDLDPGIKSQIDTAGWYEGYYNRDTSGRLPNGGFVIDSIYGMSIHDYFVQYDRKTGKITSNQPITHVTIKGTTGSISNASWVGIDSSKKSDTHSDSAHLKKDVTVISKSVTKKVSFMTVIYWGLAILLFLLLLYFIYKYRNKIKSFVLKAATGL